MQTIRQDRDKGAAELHVVHVVHVVLAISNNARACLSAKKIDRKRLSVFILHKPPIRAISHINGIMSKRSAPSVDLSIIADKRARLEQDDQLVSSNKQIALQAPKHSLKGPTMLLTGHDAEILTCKFHPNGATIASAGMDRSIFLWTTRGDCENYATIKAAHSNAILDIQFSSNGQHMVSCSADKTVIIWDSASACRIKKLRNHQLCVNAISTSYTDVNLVASVGDDCFLNIWDLRLRKCVKSYQDKYPLTCASFSKSNDHIFVGGVGNTINLWDMRTDKQQYSMLGHTNTITGLSISPDGHHLLSNSFDKTLRSWDARPFAPANRLEKIFTGHEHDFEKNLLRCSWSPKGNMVAAGSSDRVVYIWSFNTCDILYRLPGHRGSVNEVVFSPIEPLVLSGSSDRQMYLGEINYENM